MGIFSCCRPSTTESDYPPNMSPGAASPRGTTPGRSTGTTPAGSGGTTPARTPARRSPMASSGGQLSPLQQRTSRASQLDSLYNQTSHLAGEVRALRRGTRGALEGLLDNLLGRVSDLQGEVATSIHRPRARSLGRGAIAKQLQALSRELELYDKSKGLTEGITELRRGTNSVVLDDMLGELLERANELQAGIPHSSHDAIAGRLDALTTELAQYRQPGAEHAAMSYSGDLSRYTPERDSEALQAARSLYSWGPV